MSIEHLAELLHLSDVGSILKVDLLIQGILIGLNKKAYTTKNMKFIKVPAVAAIIFLMLSFLSWPYGYYTFLKIIVAGASAYYAYFFYDRKLINVWFWILVFILILFNPIIPIYINNKGIWEIFDIAAAIFFIILINTKNHE